MAGKPHIKPSRTGYSRWTVVTRGKLFGIVAERRAWDWVRAWDERNGWARLKTLTQAEIEQMVAKRSRNP